MSIEDDTNKPLPADPAAAARAAKARKAAEKAELELRDAEQSRASAAGAQPTVSSRKGQPEAIDEGGPVEMKVTFKGHGQISTGGDFGFERYARGAITVCAERNARQLFDKGWAEPVDASYADRWERMTVKETAEGARRKARFEHHMEHGVGAGEYWNSASDG